MAGWVRPTPNVGPRGQVPTVGGARAAAVVPALPVPAAVIPPVAPAILVPPADQVHYTKLSPWWYYTARLDIKDEGWKLHVSCDIGNVAAIYAALLPMLRAQNYAHKFTMTPAEVARQNGDAQQQGKILCIYPDDITQAFTIVGLIDGALHGQTHRGASPIIAHEIPVGNSVVYARYGAYNSSIFDPTRNLYVDDPIGTIHPAWIQNPWPNYPNLAALGAFPLWPVHNTQGHRRLGRKP